MIIREQDVRVKKLLHKLLHTPMVVKTQLFPDNWDDLMIIILLPVLKWSGLENYIP